MTITNYNELRNHAGHADDNPVESKTTLFMPVSGTAVVRSDGSKINIVSVSKDGEWRYTDDRGWLFRQSQLKYIRIDLDSQ